MKKMKSSLCIILSLIMLLSLAACGQQSSTPAASKGASSTYTKPQRSFDGLILEGIDMSLPIDYKVETEGLDLGGYTPEKPLKLKAASYSKKDSDMQTLATQWLGAALEDISGGAIQVDVYTDKQMGADKEILDNVTTGVLDIGMNNCAIMYNVEPMYGLVDMEYLFKGWDHVYAFLNSDLNEEYSNLLQEKCNAICLGLGCNGFRCYSNNKNAVYKVSDCKGHLVRVMESEMFLKAFSAFGCNPITMPGSEVSSALQQKTIDGQDNSPMITYTAGYYEYQPYFSEIEHTAQIYGFTFTKDKFESLTPDMQNLIRRVAKEILVAATKKAQERQGVYLEKLKEPCKTVVPASEIDKESFIKALEDAGYYDYCKGLFGEELINKIEDLAK